MHILIVILIVLIVLGLAIYAVSLIPVLKDPIKALIDVVLVMIAILFICERAGLFK